MSSDLKDQAGNGHIRTMEEFAASIGVSRPTVSKYFHDPASVRHKVREKIEAGLAATGFRPNLFAVNMNRRRTKMIGLIFPNSLDPFYMGLRRRIEAEATEAGYTPFVFSSDGRPELEANAVAILASLNVAGVIMAPLTGDALHRKRIKRFARNVPVIFIDAPFDEEEAFVGTNNAQSMALITDYLTRLGEPPCYFAMPAVNRNAADRSEAYAATMRRRGLEPIFVPVAPSGDWEFERTAYDAAQRVLAEGGFPTNIVLCANDRTALGVMAAITQAGIRVGIDDQCTMRVAGHDNQPFSEYIWPPLTTVQQNTAELGRQAILLLMERLAAEADGAPAPEVRRHILLDGDLILRSSA